MTRGEICLVDLDPTVGSEIRKTRPCVVVSPAEMHDHLRTVLVAPMTTAGREAPFRIGVNHGGRKGLILLDQVRAVDKTRLAKKLGVGLRKDADRHVADATGGIRRVRLLHRIWLPSVDTFRTFAALIPSARTAVISF